MSSLHVWCRHAQGHVTQLWRACHQVRTWTLELEGLPVVRGLQQVGLQGSPGPRAAALPWMNDASHGQGVRLRDTRSRGNNEEDVATSAKPQGRELGCSSKSGAQGRRGPRGRGRPGAKAKILGGDLVQREEQLGAAQAVGTRRDRYHPQSHSRKAVWRLWSPAGQRRASMWELHPALGF